MPDYLEESLENANRLLEQVRRLERELSGLEQQNAGQEEALCAYGGVRMFYLVCFVLFCFETGSFSGLALPTG